MNDPEFIDQFEVLRVLGHGGMGKVYLCRDTNLARQVAIKVVSLDDAGPDQQTRKAFSDRLIHEARLAATLEHPSIVTIHHFGLFKSQPYIVMQFVEGCSLDSLLASKALDRKEAIRILQETAIALDYAHSKGIVHRDIKPANIMLADRRSVKLCDFGIAKSLVFSTKQSILAGTPPYMAPEQLMYKSISGRTDQWALGVMAYEILTRRLPFDGESSERIAELIVNGPIPPIRELEPTLVERVSTVLQRALSKDPTARFDTCTVFIAALGQAFAPATVIEERRTYNASGSGKTQTAETDKRNLFIRLQSLWNLFFLCLYVGVPTLLFWVGSTVGLAVALRNGERIQPSYVALTLLFLWSFSSFSAWVFSDSYVHLELRNDGFTITTLWNWLRARGGPERKSKNYKWVEIGELTANEHLKKVSFKREGWPLSESLLPEKIYGLSAASLAAEMNAFRSRALSNQQSTAAST